jgi:hypothetical protein
MRKCENDFIHFPREDKEITIYASTTKTRPTKSIQSFDLKGLTRMTNHLEFATHLLHNTNSHIDHLSC